MAMAMILAIPTTLWSIPTSITQQIPLDNIPFKRRIDALQPLAHRAVELLPCSRSNPRRTLTTLCLVLYNLRAHLQPALDLTHARPKILEDPKFLSRAIRIFDNLDDAGQASDEYRSGP